jgi:hypothetical protein
VSYNFSDALHCHRDFLQFMQVPITNTGSGDTISDELQFDLEWLAVLRRTHTLLQTHSGVVHMPQEIRPVSEQVRRYVAMRAL